MVFKTAGFNHSPIPPVEDWVLETHPQTPFSVHGKFA